jgi:preprotein translocase subunit SecD
MTKSLRWKVPLILAILVLFGALGLYPIVAPRIGINGPQWLMNYALRLGLDLKGGVHLVLRVHTDDALKLETDLTADRIREELARRNIAVQAVTTENATTFRIDGVPPAQDAEFRRLADDLQPGVGRGRVVSLRDEAEHRHHAA